MIFKKCNSNSSKRHQTVAMNNVMNSVNSYTSTTSSNQEERKMVNKGYIRT